jgi:hypothetical protein
MSATRDIERSRLVRKSRKPKEESLASKAAIRSFARTWTVDLKDRRFTNRSLASFGTPMKIPVSIVLITFTRMLGSSSLSTAARRNYRRDAVRRATRSQGCRSYQVKIIIAVRSLGT